MMDPRSESFFPYVELDLVRILRFAPQTPQPWVVIFGIRTVAQEAAACASGHSQTMHSMHLPGCHGLSRAVDVWALIDGKASDAAGHEPEVFGQIAKQIMGAAATLKLPLMWGGADVGAWRAGQVSHFHDWGHFQLPESLYP